jgi:hypothetical protein
VYLNQYITQVQRLLHDTNAQYWSVSELTDYINEARNRVAKDTRCCRQQLLSFPIVYNTEQYTLATVQAYAATALGVGYDVVDVMGINIYWGSTRIKLAFLPWTRFDVQFRYWTNMQSRPVCYSKQGMTNIFVGPIPDQNYNSDWDVSLIPPPLAATSAVPNPQDTDITEPFATSVKYYAAYLAKFREQAMGEANIFEQMYLKNTFTETKAYTYRIIPDPYAK